MRRGEGLVPRAARGNLRGARARSLLHDSIQRSFDPTAGPPGAVRRARLVEAARGAGSKSRFRFQAQETVEDARRPRRRLGPGARPQGPARPGPSPDDGQPSLRAGPALHDQVPARRRDRQGPPGAPGEARDGGRRGDADPGGHLVLPVAGARQGRPALDHRDAPRRAAARRPALGGLFRADQGGLTALPRDERRGRDPQPGGHRAGRGGGRSGDRRLRARLPLPFQRQAHPDRARRAVALRLRHAVRLQDPAAAVSRALEDQRRDLRPAHRVVLRGAGGQGLPGGAAGGPGLHQGRPPVVPQRGPDADQLLGDRRRLDAAPRGRSASRSWRSGRTTSSTSG